MRRWHFNKEVFLDRDMAAPGNTPVSPPKKVRMAREEFHLELALNVAKPAMEWRTALHFNRYQAPVQTVYKQDPGGSTAPQACWSLQKFLLHRKVCQISWD